MKSQVTWLYPYPKKQHIPCGILWVRCDLETDFQSWIKMPRSKLYQVIIYLPVLLTFSKLWFQGLIYFLKLMNELPQLLYLVANISNRMYLEQILTEIWSHYTKFRSSKLLNKVVKIKCHIIAQLSFDNLNFKANCLAS